jgi:capsular exopolysaccharide synthesis family protein
MEGDRDLIPGRGESLVNLWQGLVKQRWLILAGVVVGLLTTGLYCIYAKRNYTAYAQLKYDPDKGSALNLGDISAAAVTGSATDEKLQTEVLVLQSETLAFAVINALHLWDNPLFVPSSIVLKPSDRRDNDEIVRRFRSSLIVRSVPKSNLIEISFRTLSPDLSASMANSLIDKYIERNYRVKYEGTMKASGWLSEQLEAIRKRTEASENALAEYQRRTGVFAFSSNRNSQSGEGDDLITTQLSETMKALTVALSDRIVKEARYRVAIGGDPELLAGMIPDTTLSVLHAQEVSIKSQYSAAKIQFGGNYPRVKELKSQLDDLTAEIAAEVASDTLRLKDEYEAAKDAEDALEKQLSSEKTTALDSNKKVLELLVLEREAESNRELYEGLSRKLQEAGITAGLNSTNVEIVDYARAPWKPSVPKVGRTMAFGLLGGLGLGCLLGFVRSTLDNTVASIEDTEAGLGLPVIGVIPSIRPIAHGTPNSVEADQGLLAGSYQAAYTQPKSEAAEAFRSLRTSILLSQRSVGSKAIAVTSCMPGDGKSTVSSNLSVVLAQSGVRVLLIDADMRLGQLQRRFQSSMPDGLSAVLAGVTSLTQAVHASEQVSNLNFLFAGPVPPFPAELLASPAMALLIDECRHIFDFIVVDTPPVLAVTDAVIVSALVDRTILVVRPGYTNKVALKRTANVLRRAGAAMGGAVVNAMSIDKSTYYNYYYHQEGNSKYYGDTKNES